MKVIVGSKNPVKLEVARQAFSELYKNEEVGVEGHEAESKVSDQPIGTKETKLGAYNRSLACQEAFSEADYWIGLEGGLIEEGDNYRTVAWACVLGRAGVTSYAPSAGFLLPPKLTELIKAGEELGDATDTFFGSVNSKHKGGTIGILTNDVVTRTDQYKMALLFALIPFINSDLYSKK